MLEDHQEMSQSTTWWEVEKHTPFHLLKPPSCFLGFGVFSRVFIFAKKFIQNQKKNLNISYRWQGLGSWLVLNPHLVAHLLVI